MNNEYESGRYGTHIKYFQNMDDYKDYLDSSVSVKQLPNVAYCDGLTKYVNYNWSTDNIVVLTNESNSTVYGLLYAAGIEPSTPDGYTADDLANITLDQIYCYDGPSGGFGGESIGWGDMDDRADLNFCDGGLSIFYMFGFNGGDPDDVSTWSFPEFQYFTSITEIPTRMFTCCYGLTDITIPSSVTYIGDNAFHDCYRLESVTIKNTSENVDIYDIEYANEEPGVNDSAFSYTGCGIEISQGGESESEIYSIDPYFYTSPLDRMIKLNMLKFES